MLNSVEIASFLIDFHRVQAYFTTFLLHPWQDTYVPTEMVYRLYDAKPTPKQLWTVPNTGHADSYINFLEEYTKKVKEFVSEY